MGAYLLKDENAVYYECGYSCDNEVFFRINEREAYFLTDSRYAQEARAQVKGAEVVIAADLIAALRGIIRKEGIKKIKYDPYDLKAADLASLKKSGAFFAEAPRLSWKKRAIKSEDEISLIRQSAAKNAECFEKFAKFLQEEGEGESEKRLHYRAKEILSGFGTTDLSFEPIFAIGENAAKPHATPSNERILRIGDLVLFDAGIKFKRYCSDRTRTAQFDENLRFDYLSRFSKSKIQRAYDLVLKAHDEVIKRVRVGMRAKDADKIAREVIEKGNMGEFFIHSTGHGVGLDIHEMPFISPRSDTVLEENMVFTVEPGIYIEGEFGIRVEDIVVLKSDGAEIL